MENLIEEQITNESVIDEENTIENMIVIINVIAIDGAVTVIEYDGVATLNEPDGGAIEQVAIENVNGTGLVRMVRKPVVSLRWNRLNGCHGNLHRNSFIQHRRSLSCRALFLANTPTGLVLVTREFPVDAKDKFLLARTSFLRK